MHCFFSTGISRTWIVFQSTDSHTFEVDKYMHKMFVEKQLPGLVQADNELVADIRQLDGDMKTLVYENYSKFLSATDTINKVTIQVHHQMIKGHV